MATDGRLATIWVTREGRRVPVVEISDAHLINTIRFLRRNTIAGIQSEINAGYSLLGTLQGEMAIDAVERDLRRLENADIDECLSDTCPTYDALLAEAEKRGLQV